MIERLRPQGVRGTDRLGELIRLSRNWSHHKRGRDLCEAVGDTVQKLFQIESGFFVYLRQMHPERPAIVVSPWGCFQHAETDLLGLLRPKQWFNEQTLDYTERWLAETDVPEAVKPLFSRFGVKRMSLWPLTVNHRYVGAMVLCTSLDLPASDTNLLTLMHMQFSLVAEMLLLRRFAEQESRSDALTGLFNRRGFIESVPEFSADRIDRALVLGIVDINEFKKINDSHGHQSGDEALKHTADLLRGHLESDAVVSRWGGDEFVFLWDTDLSHAEAAQRVHRWFEEAPFHVSVGCESCFYPKEDWQSSLAQADKRLYEDKVASTRPEPA